MTELKTLKDLSLSKLEFRERRSCEYFVENLKEEAIKWVKKCVCERIKVKIQDNDEPMKEEIHRNYCFACLRFINFFNLSEEDLK